MTVLLSILRLAWPYLLAGSVAFGVAWKIQGFRLDAADNEFAEYKLAQERAAIASEREANERRDQTAAAWAANLDALRACYKPGGKCLPKLPAGSGIKVPPSGGIDAPGADTGTATGGYAAVGEDSLIYRCAQTTLQLNLLQADIEGQK